MAFLWASAWFCSFIRAKLGFEGREGLPSRSGFVSERVWDDVHENLCSFREGTCRPAFRIQVLSQLLSSKLHNSVPRNLKIHTLINNINNNSDNNKKANWNNNDN